MQRDTQDFIDILQGFFDQYMGSGVLFPEFQETVTDAALQVLGHPDVEHVPGYKITSLMADMVNIAASISSDGWLTNDEALARLESHLDLSGPLIQYFLADARIERARYEPVMLTEDHTSPATERNAILNERFHRMIDARQTYSPLPHSFVDEIAEAAELAIQADEFRYYRSGPMLQFFADMIQQADMIAEDTFDEDEGIQRLRRILSDNGRLWKIYRAKSARFSAPDGDPLYEEEFASKANMLFIPDADPMHPTFH